MGYYAKTQSEELRAPDLELNQLVSIEDVTSQVNAAVKSDMSAADANKARQAAMAEIEQASKTKTGLRSDVITLYGGARYHLYRYKQYTDVRLVWAPKQALLSSAVMPITLSILAIVSMSRFFESTRTINRPKSITFCRLNAQGAQEGDLIFVSGNPGRTRRILTADAMAYQRDYRLPKTLDLLRRKENLLQQYNLAGPEQARRGQDDLFGIQNSRKAYMGMLGGLQDPGFMKNKRESEAKMKAAASKIPGASEAWKASRKYKSKDWNRLVKKDRCEVICIRSLKHSY